MRKDITVEVSAADRVRLEAVVADRNSPQKHAWRAKIILATADGLGTAEIMRRSGKSKPSVWRWQERFMTDGVDGLLRDKTRPSRIPPLEQTIIDRVIALTATEPPHQATHWTAAAMAKATGISVSSVQRIWRAHKLQPHRVRSFELSTDAVRRQAARHRRALHRSAGACRGPLGRREVAYRSPRSDPTGPAPEKGPVRDHDT